MIPCIPQLYYNYNYVQDPRQSPKKSKHPEIDEVSFLHFNNPELLPWHPKYKEEMFPNLPNSVKHMIEEWLNGKHISSYLCFVK